MRPGWERRWVGAITAVITVGMCACGGGGGGTAASERGSLSFQARWQPAGDTSSSQSGQGSQCDGFGTAIPPQVNGIRFKVDNDAAGFHCCIGIRRGSAPFEERSLVLNNLPSGVADFTITGFPTLTVPADNSSGATT